MRYLFLILLALSSMSVLVGCPPTGDDDSASDDDDNSPSDGDLCDISPGCESNMTACPSSEPSAGDACTGYDNCHYCNGDGTAEGYTCGGTSFTSAGTFTCE